MDISRPCQPEKLIPLLPWPGFDPSFSGHNDRRAIISEWTWLRLRPLSHRGWPYGYFGQVSRSGTSWNQPEVSTTSGAKVMAQIVVFMYLVTLTFDLCSIFCHTQWTRCSGISMQSFIRIWQVLMGDTAVDTNTNTHTQAHSHSNFTNPFGARLINVASQSWVPWTVQSVHN